MRLFVAINLPDDVKRELWYLSQHLEHQAQQARIVPLENYHLTLLFIGETKRIAEARDALYCVRLPDEPIEFSLEGIGHFKQARAHTWWVGVTANKALETLAGELGAAYRNAGFSIESRPFKPHITLARKVITSRPLELMAPPFTLKAERLSLMRSENEKNRMVYTEIDALEL